MARVSYRSLNISFSLNVASNTNRTFASPALVSLCFCAKGRNVVSPGLPVPDTGVLLGFIFLELIWPDPGLTLWPTSGGSLRRLLVSCYLVPDTDLLLVFNFLKLILSDSGLNLELTSAGSPRRPLFSCSFVVCSSLYFVPPRSLVWSGFRYLVL